MAVYRYEEERPSESYSANTIRLELERQRALQKEYEQSIKQFDAEAEAAARKQQEQTKRNADYARRAEQERHNFLRPNSGDSLSREIRAQRELADFQSNYVIGMAAAIGSYAKDEAHIRDVQNAINDLKVSNAETRESKIAELERTETRTLSELNREAEEKLALASSLSQSYYVEFNDTRKEADMVKRAAEEAYQRQSGRLEQKEEQLNDRYKDIIHKTEEVKQRADVTLREQTEKSDQERRIAISTAEQTYNKDVAEIKKQYTGEEQSRRIELASTRRDETISRAETKYAKDVQSHQDEHKAMTTSAQRELDVASQKYNESMLKINDKKVEIRESRDNKINHQNDVIREAQIKYQTAVNEVSSSATNAQMRRDNYLAQKEMNHQKAMDNIDNAAGSRIITPTGKTSRDAVQLIKLTQDIAESVAKDTITLIGTAEEKALLQKVQANVEAQAKAAAENKPFLSSLSKSDEVKYQEMIIKHSGDISTKNNIATTIGHLDRNIDVLNKKMASNDRALAAINTDIKNIDQKISALQKEISAPTEARMMLMSGKNAEGKKLTQGEVSHLNHIIKISGNLDEKNSKIASLIAEKNKLEAAGKEIGNANGIIGSTIQQSVVLKKHLEKNGNIIADTVKEAKPIFALNKVDKNATIGEKFGGHGKNAAVVAGTLGAVAISGALGGFIGSTATRDQFLAKIEARRNQGMSEKQIERKRLAEKRVQKSVDMIQKKSSQLLQKDNAIHYEFTKGAKQAEKIEKFIAKANKNLKIAKSASAKFLANNQNVKIIGKALALKSKFNATKVGKFVNFAGKGVGAVGVGVLGFGVAAMTAPYKLAQLPNMILNKSMHAVAFGSERVAKAGVRYAAKGVGYGVAGAKKLGNATFGRAGRAIGNAFKNSKVGKFVYGQLNNLQNTQFWQGAVMAKFKANAWMNKAREFAKAKVPKLAEKITNIFNFITGGWKEWLIGLLTTILTVILQIIGLTALILIMFIAVFALIMIILSLLASLIGAVSGFFGRMNATQQSYVKNYPEYIINQAVKYRNGELAIFNLFLDANQENIDGTVPAEILAVSSDPIYQALYDNSLTHSLKRLFGYDTVSDFRTDAINTKTRTMYEEIDTYLAEIPYDSETETPWKFVGVVGGDLNFKSDVQEYEYAKINYYYMRDENGGKKTSISNGYEISNAKSALGLVDAIYTEDADTMQKIEVLSYLGLGEDQLVSSEGVENNLFWSTHKINYTQGNAKEDIYFHETVRQGSGFPLNTRAGYYPLANNTGFGHQHAAEASVASGSGLVYRCDNYRRVSLKIEHEVYEKVGTTTAHSSAEECSDIFDGGSCSHREDVYDWVTKSKTIDFDICPGHIVLSTEMVVAVVDEENPYFFKIAQELPEQNAERVGGLLFTGYSAADVYGFGPLDIGAYNPAEDWDPEGSLIDLAIYKTNNDFAYQVPNGEDAGAMSISIRQRLDDLYFNTLATGEESVVLYQIKIDDSIYKLPALINGDQKRIPAYLGSSEVEVSTKCNVHGIPSVGR